jgi:hypothetical protein
MTDVEIGSIWKHRKGAKYRVLGFCTLEATEERAVLYRLNRISGDFSDGEFVWCRPLSAFCQDARSNCWPRRVRA